MKRYLVALLVTLLAVNCAQASEAIVFGHNLSPTTYTLARGEASVGNFIAGVGLSEHFTIGTSPWMYTSYNMYSVVGRYGRSLDDIHRWSVQAAYFKTGRFLTDVYQMEATSVWLSGSRKLAPHYTFNLVMNHMYFMDETAPFSLRREPMNNDPWQVSLTTLHEIDLVSGFGILAELGTLGLNYVYPQMFYGASINWRNHWLLAQMGFSQNLSLSGASRLYTPQQAYSGRKRGDYFDFDMHPEIHLQVFF